MIGQRRPPFKVGSKPACFDRRPFEGVERHNSPVLLAIMRRVRIRAASQALGVPVPTLRRWTQEFAGGLSPEARASEGRPREFSARDMRILRRAKEILGREDVTY